MNAAFVQLIKTKRPLLKRLLDERGLETLEQLAQCNINVCQAYIHPRASEFIAVLKEITQERLGEQVARRVEQQFLQCYAALTTDHHGTLNSSLGLSANLMFGESIRAADNPALTVVPVLSCASISQRNDEYPRGIMFHAEKQGAYTVEKLSLLPNATQGSVVWGFRSFTMGEVVKIERHLQGKTGRGEVSSVLDERVRNLIAQLYKNTWILEPDNLCAQFTRVNFNLWKDTHDNDPHTPDLLMVESEELVVRLLLQHHMREKTIIHNLFFGFASSLLVELTQAMVTYLRQGALQTYLFWWVDDKNRRVNLRLNGTMLVSEDELVQLPLEPTAIQEALRSRRLMPNLLTKHLVMYLYYGLNCLGGFNQIHFHNAMRSIYNASGLDPIQTNAQSLYAFGLNPVLLGASHTIAPYPSDVLLYPELKLLHRFKQAFKNQTLNQAFSRDWQVVYDILSEHS